MLEIPGAVRGLSGIPECLWGNQGSPRDWGFLEHWEFSG